MNNANHILLNEHICILNQLAKLNVACYSQT